MRLPIGIEMAIGLNYQNICDREFMTLFVDTIDRNLDILIQILPYKYLCRLFDVKLLCGMMYALLLLTIWSTRLGGWDTDIVLLDVVRNV